MNIFELLRATVNNNASDLHLSTGNIPLIRVDGELVPLPYKTLNNEESTVLIYQTMSESQIKIFGENLELDYSYHLCEQFRFRVNAYHQSQGIAAAFRVIPNKLPTLDDLGLPASVKELCKERNGIILVTGPAGSGKSTTLAAMINTINLSYNKHIITLEDPIEFYYISKKCLINQRQLHRDTQNYQNALRAALREDANVILIGEMRDLETTRLALTAAETGQLVLATLHTNSAVKTIDRIISMFPGSEQPMIRTMLSSSLRAIISQTLVKRRVKGRVVAVEILVATGAVSNLIRENKVSQIYTILQTSQSQGMCTLEQHLAQLVADQVIDPDA